MMHNLHSMHTMHLCSGFKTWHTDVGIMPGVRQGTWAVMHQRASRPREACASPHAHATHSAHSVLSPSRRTEQYAAYAADQVRRRYTASREAK